MKKLLPIIAFCLVLLSCTKHKSYFDLSVQYSEGNSYVDSLDFAVFRHQGELFSGVVYVPVIGWETEKLWELNVKDGLPHGRYRLWYPNGQLEKEYSYEYGQQNDLHREWSETGQLGWEGSMKDGQLNGLVREWYENGYLKYEENYKDGLRHGLYKSWYKDGELKETRNYKNGRVIK